MEVESPRKGDLHLASGALLPYSPAWGVSLPAVDASTLDDILTSRKIMLNSTTIRARIFYITLTFTLPCSWNVVAEQRKDLVKYDKVTHVPQQIAPSDDELHACTSYRGICLVTNI